MNENVMNLLLAESTRVQELIKIINETVVPPYDGNKGWIANAEHYEKDSIVRQAKSELKQRLTMLRKDAILLRKELEQER